MSPVFVIADAKQDDEILNKCKKHKESAGDEPDFDALQFKCAGGIVPETYDI